MKEIIDSVKENFIDYFDNKGYVRNSSVKITSGIDKSVVFIGSTISVLKPKLLYENIDITGDYLIQRAIRTRGLKNMTIPQKEEWASYFDATGILVPYEKLNNLVYDVIDFLVNKLSIRLEDILIRVSSKDNDLVRTIYSLKQNILVEYDTREFLYYRHKYGLQDYGIYGRNFNIALRDFKTGEFKDIGNIIVIESIDKKYGVECAIGINAILMRILGLQTSIEASSIVDIYSIESTEDCKLADCLSVVSHLAYENVIGLKKRNYEYLFKKYLKYLKFWAEKLKISNEDLLDMIKSYILLEYNDFNDIIIENNVKRFLSREVKNGK